MNYIVSKSLKSKGTAVLLTILLGGVGLFYSSILGGIIMTLFFPVILIILFMSGQFILGIFLACSYYLICMIWAIAAVSDFNRKVLNNATFLGQNQSDNLQYRKTDESNYYDEYRKSMSRDRSLFWAFITALICGLIFYFIYKYKYQILLVF